jgi:hypothetical protein
MNTRFCAVAVVFASFAIASSALTKLQFQVSGSTQKGASVCTRAAGIFEVKITSPASSDNEDASLAIR